MSVINNMLRNLDERRAGQLGLAGAVGAMHGQASNVLMPEVAVVPRADRPLRRLYRAAPVMLGLLAVAAVYGWQNTLPTAMPKALLASVNSTPPIAQRLAAAPLAAPVAVPVLAEQSAAMQVPTAKLPEVSVEPLPEPSSYRVFSLATSLALTSDPVGKVMAAVMRTTQSWAPAPRTAAVTTPAKVQLPLASVPAEVTPPPVNNASIRLESSTQSVPERNLAEVQRAADLQRRGALPEAETVLRSVLDNDKGHVVARLALVSLLSRQQRSDDARKVLKEGVEIAPTQSQLLLPYARQLAERGEWSAAQDALMPAADALAQDAEYRALQGAVLQHLGRFPQSSAEYRAAVRLLPSAGAWWMGLGLSLEGEGRRSDARSAYLQAKASKLSADLAQFVDNKLARLGPTD